MPNLHCLQLKMCHVTLICKALKIYFEGEKITAISSSSQGSQSLSTPYSCYT